MRTWLAPILALVLCIGIHPGQRLLPSPDGHNAGRSVTALRATPDLALIDEYMGLTKPEIVFPVTVTAYSSSHDQCDSDPFVTASNKPVRDGIIALSRDLIKRYNPDAPFTWGDRVRIPGVGEFIVEDAMNARYTRRADIWFPDRKQAKDWGVKELKLVVPPDESWII